MPAQSPVAASPSDDLETRLIRWCAELRLGWAVGGLLTTIAEWRHYRRPRRAAAAVAIALCESIWAIRRSGRRDDVVGSVASTVLGASTLMLVSTAAGPEDQFGGFVDWAFHSMLWTSGSAAFRTPNLAAGSSVMGVSIAAYVARISAIAPPEDASRAWINGLQFAAFFGGAAVLSRNLRSTGQETLVAQLEALEKAGRAAAGRARRTAIAELHVGALDALTRVGDLWNDDRSSAQRVAAAEAARLRHLVDSRGGTGDRLLVAFGSLAEDVARQGGRLDLVPDVSHTPNVMATDALVAASREVLACIGGSTATVRCVLRVEAVEDSVAVTLRQLDLDAGVDLDALRARTAPLLEPVNGSLDLASPAGRGVRVHMRVAT